MVSAEGFGSYRLTVEAMDPAEISDAMDHLAEAREVMLQAVIGALSAPDLQIEIALLMGVIVFGTAAPATVLAYRALLFVL